MLGRLGHIESPRSGGELTKDEQRLRHPKPLFSSNLKLVTARLNGGQSNRRVALGDSGQLTSGLCELVEPT
jgi:hypothetical protein